MAENVTVVLSADAPTSQPRPRAAFENEADAGEFVEELDDDDTHHKVHAYGVEFHAADNGGE